MEEIKKIPESQLIDFVNLSRNAYPAFAANTQEEKDRMVTRYTYLQNEVPNENLYGYYRDEQLLGGMLLHEFTMNMLSKKVNIGGVGMVAVDFMHKKEHIAKDLIIYFLNHIKENNGYFATLYPFRPDFYKKMGFGYGTKVNQYTVLPSSFPQSDLRKNVVYLTEEDKEGIRDCFNEFVLNNHGMYEMTFYEFSNLFKNPRMRIVGYKENGKIEGFMFFGFKSDNNNFIVTDLVVNKLIYNSSNALVGLSAFLNSQSDQIRHVILNTQDENVHFLIFDPRNQSNHLIPHVYHESNVQGVGLMYRLVDTKAFFKDFSEHNFNEVNIKLKLTINDNFINENNGSFVIEFKNGYPQIREDDIYDAEVIMDISDFTSLVMGVVEFKTLYKYGVAKISSLDHIKTVNKLFKTDTKPICMTEF